MLLFLLVTGFGMWFLFKIAQKLISFVFGGGQTVPIIKVSSVTDQEENKPVFRPSNFEEYIGQIKAKNILKTYIEATKERGMVCPHIIISGVAGTGKTTLANIIAKQLDVNFVEVIASGLENTENLYNKIIETDGGILFIDEVHGADRSLVETIYMAMEDFQINGLPVKPFTLIGATTELGEIIQDRKPFYERFKIRIKLQDYTPEELGIIAQQWKEKSYPDDPLEENIYTLIGSNSRGAPRTAIRLTEAVVLFKGNIGQVLENYDIIKEGYTNEDLKILEYVAENEKGVGLNGLISFLNTSKANYSYEIEPYLVQNRLIQRTPRGRKITEGGIQKSKELREVHHET